MSTLPIIHPSTSMVLTVEPLTPEVFSPFGTVIMSPLSSDTNAIPSDLSKIPRTSTSPKSPNNHDLNPTGGEIQFANQRTALKTSPVSPLINNYHGTSKGLMSVFSCFPRKNVYIDGKDESNRLKLQINILERHPFTTQTFCPFNHSNSSDKTLGGKTYFLVVVASNLRQKQNQNKKEKISNPPDLSSIRAFIAPSITDGGLGTAITYHPGTWHAPMIVLGERRIDFLVSQFVNGINWDDCQEVMVGEEKRSSSSTTTQTNGGGSDDSRIVEVDLSGLGLEDTYLWKSRKSKL